ncbi:histidine kinase [Planomonospora parontospora subsp. parontospora]|uniref:histidine kinase n=2 Tax=Planomonospora parontospora TaxID=58119 RepID=A0AA37BIC8_9ACTN|nr:nitrate- and nitrite sensing domain-containing protein [Planomonospora parontospora]GGK75076.1 histidine kinase [Planomonospora parontospora]GII09516.1 histidine kinase [Planomonospora parontospora subsp. parontospora]
MSTQKTRDGGFRLRNWRVRSRLIALILVPTAAAVLLGGVQVFGSVRAAAEYQRVNDLARLSDHIGALTHELAGERDRTAWFIALGRPERGEQGVRDRMNAVDRAAVRVRESGALLRDAIGGRTGDEIEAALARLEDLAQLRRQALEETLLPDAAIDAYSLVIADLLSLHDELGKGSSDDLLFGRSLTLDALARAKESLSLQRGLLSVVLVAGRFEQEQMERFLGALASEQSERRAFAAEAGVAERRFFDEAVNGGGTDRSGFLRELVLLRAASGAPLRGLDLAEKDDAGQWYEAVSATIDRMRTVEERHARQIVARSGELGDAERNRALLAAGSVAGLLLAVLLITSGVARSLVRPLRRLRREALEVAGERLPQYVQRVRESRDGEIGGLGDIAAEVPPIGVLSRDEIGEVARAFDEVHREAVRLAGDEAKLRHTVNAMFVNLSRRSQTLVERQLTLVERLERGERDDRRLADLFKLDHLATRMRRNSENLLVLAGQEVARRWRNPVEVMDVVRAALSEVENYDRVVTRVQSEVAVAGPAVSDVVHLLAELVENALSFSPGETEVVVSSSRIDGGGVMISVTDQGIGMTADELAEVNRRLADPQPADASVARRMGLFVVGRLALKHGIRVRLRPQESGLTAMVLLPEDLLAPLPGASPAAPAQASPFDLAASRSFPPFPSFPSGPEAVPAAGPDRGPARPRTPATLSAPLPEGVTALPPQTRQPGPLPGTGTSALDAGDEYLPIFASVESGWFRTGTLEPVRGPGPAREEPASAGEPGGRPPTAAPGQDWSSPADSGWQAARAVSEPAHGGLTTSGLPKRTPKANLVPGSVPASPAQAPAGLRPQSPPGSSGTPPQPLARPPQPVAPLSAERVRDRMASFQQGVRRARNELPNRES